jgi:hypothetical protein
VEADDRNNACAYLDVAVIPYFLNMGGSSIDAKTYYVRLLKACLVQESHGADCIIISHEDGLQPDVLTSPLTMDIANDMNEPVVKKAKVVVGDDYKAKLKSEYDSVVAAIKAEKKPPHAQDKEWANEQRDKITSARKQFNQRVANIDDNAAVEAAAEAIQGTMMDIEDWLTEAVDSEMTTFKQMRTQQKALYGDPLDLSVDVPARYEFWPENAHRMPLLNFCAEMLLGGMGASTENERFHSLAGYVMNKVRSSMKVETLEMLTLSKFVIMDRLKADAKRAKTFDSMIDFVDSALENIGTDDD